MILKALIDLKLQAEKQQDHSIPLQEKQDKSIEY
jgi:hypothetical protein